MNKKQIVDYTRDILSEAFTNVSSNAKTDSTADSKTVNICVHSKSLILFVLILICVLFNYLINPVKAVVFYQFLQEGTRRIDSESTLLCGSQKVLHKSTSIETQITPFQADEIKRLVKEVSLREQKTPNMVHRELKRTYKYTRYREINSEQYHKVRQSLLNRLQN